MLARGGALETMVEDKTDLEDHTQVCAEVRRQATEIKQLRAQLDGIIADPDITYLKTALPRPQPRDIAVMQGIIAGNKSAARAVPEGTAHAGLKREANPWPLRAARQGPKGGLVGGDAAAGPAPTQDGPQQQKSMAGDQQDHSKQGYAERKARKDQSRSGGGKGGAASAGGTGAVKATRNNAAAGSQRGAGGVNSTFAATAKKPVTSKRVGGSGGDSGESRHS